MPKEYSPFTPGQPVPIDFFVGRVQEINRLKSALEESQTGRLRVAFLTGERGIGKSSLAAFVRYLGERDYQVLGIHTFLGGVTSLEEMVRRIFDRLLKESIGKSWQKKIERFFGNHIREIGLFGISLEFAVPKEDLKRMVHDFVPAIRRLVAEVRDEKKSLFLILDDLNGLASNKEFAEWLKSLVDEIATSNQPVPLFILLVGLEERRQALIASQPSLARVFDVVDIRAWRAEETEEFFKTAFSKVEMEIEPNALQILVQYCGGLPVLAHEIGDATFRADQDGKIDHRDALNGIVAAADIVGRKHLEPQVFQAIRSQRYRAILRKLAAPPFDRKFRRSELRKHLTSDQARVLDNFLTRMKQLGVIRPDPEEGPGAYSFGNLLHYLYMRIEAARARETHER